MSVTPQEAVDTANAVFGRHPRSRALHAKGTLLKGTFTATPAGAALTRAAQMQGQPVQASVRVSNAAGNPELPDYPPDIRGLAVKFELPDGAHTDIVCQSLPRFPFQGPGEFVEFLRAGKRDAGIIVRLPAFLARHPGLIGAMPANLAALRPPESYATIPYYGIHAFRWVDADGGSRYVRYTWRPEARVARLKPRDAKARGRDYLQQEIRDRLRRGPVGFTLELQVAAPGDPVDDPSAQWPESRERVEAGRLEILVVDADRDENSLVFDPARVRDGIELSDDPVLRFRPQAYSESVKRRTS